MTQVYTHTSQAAARLAVGALPSIMDDDKPKALKADPASIVSGIKAIAKAMTLANLADKKAELLTLLTS